MTIDASFKPGEHLMTIKNRQGNSDYLPVQWRLFWFRNECPEGTLFTEMVHMDLDKEVESEIMQWDNETRRMKSVTKHGYGVAVFKATITDGRGGSSTGYGSEKASDFGDFLEKAETKSIGRALAALGYGTQFAPDLEEGSRIVDAPVVSSDQPRTPDLLPAQVEARKQISETNVVPATSDESLTIDAIFMLYSSTFNQGWERVVTSVVGGKYAPDRMYTMVELKKLFEKVQFMLSKMPAKPLQNAS